MGIFNRHNRQPKPEIQPGDSALVKRLKRYGSRGITLVHSAEGQPVPLDAVKYLRPAGPDYTEPEKQQ